MRLIAFTALLFATVGAFMAMPLALPLVVLLWLMWFLWLDEVV